MEDINREKYKRAKKRVEELKGLHIHMTVYVLVNLFILINIYIKTDDFWQWPHFLTVFFWGIGLAFHAAKVLNFNPILGKSWEKRMIDKILEEDKEEMDKFI